MHQFFIGIFFGVLLMGAFTFQTPLLLSGVQQELVKQGHGTYHPTTREFVLKECK